MVTKTRLTRIDVLALAAILMVGAIHLPFPFRGDQALFALGALKMDSGGILYHDFWDFKQPAIYQFYFLAGKLFGFSEFGVHAFELLYMATFAVVLILTLKRYYTHPAIAAAMPLMTVGVYYGVSGAWGLTQVEGLVGFPMFLALWLASESPPPGRGRAVRFFLSGVMGGVVVLFKFVFLPILAAFWVTAVIKAVSGDKRGGILAPFIRICSPAVLGMLLPLGVVLGYYVRYASLDLLYKTYVVYPNHIIENLPTNLNKLLVSIEWFGGWAGFLMFLAVIGAYVGIFIRRNLIALNLTLWFVLGVFLIIVQRMWWEYHYLLLVFPLGILASWGLNIIWKGMKDIKLPVNLNIWRIVLIISLLMGFIPMVNLIGKKAIFLINDGFAINKEKRLIFQSRFVDNYLRITEEVGYFFKSESAPGDIYVFGNPLYYWFSGRNQAISVNGWAIQHYTDEQFEKLKSELNAALPAYIVVEGPPLKFLKERTPRIVALIEDKYRVKHENNGNVFYVLK